MILNMMDNQFVASDAPMLSPCYTQDKMHWLQAYQQFSPAHFVNNIQTEFKLIKINDTLLPVTINHTEYTNSYVVSPYTAFISYAREELVKINHSVVRFALRCVINSLDGLFRLMKINRVIMINNWLLSTNLYPQMDTINTPYLIEMLTKQYPRHVLVFRSLNYYTNGSLINKLIDAGCFLSSSRQVYIFDPTQDNYLSKNNCKNDLRLVKNTHYRYIKHDEIAPADYPRIVELYHLLYLEKYSQHNPQFNEAFIALAHAEGFLYMVGLRDPSGRLDGIIGYFQIQDVITAPLVGYDTHLPKSLGLYRLLMIHVLQKTKQEKLLLNLSSGASDFKRLRGGKPYIEYSAVYTKHLRIHYRIFWRFIQGLSNGIAKPLLKKYEL